VVRDSQKRTLRGSDFQRVGADAQKEREPARRLVRGNGKVWILKSVKLWSGGSILLGKLRRRPVSKALNVSVAILN